MAMEQKSAVFACQYDINILFNDVINKNESSIYCHELFETIVHKKPLLIVKNVTVSTVTLGFLSECKMLIYLEISLLALDFKIGQTITLQKFIMQ